MEATILNKKEAEVLLKAETEIANNGHTDIVCPRCGGKLITESNGKATSTFCVNRDIILTGRGI